MTIRTIQPMQALSFHTETSFNEIGQYVRVVAKDLYQEAIKNGLEIAGPIYWIYKGADGQPNTKFSLTIALPVIFSDLNVNTSRFEIKEIPAFRCVSRTHNGSWEKLGETYGNLISEILVKEPSMSGENREVYINMDFDNPTANITEVQIGLA